MMRKDHIAWITMKACNNKDTPTMMWHPEACAVGKVEISCKLDVVIWRTTS
jgi:hypothetical protein